MTKLKLIKIVTKCTNCGSTNIKYVEQSPLGGGFIHSCLECKKEFTIDRIAQ